MPFRVLGSVTCNFCKGLLHRMQALQEVGYSMMLSTAPVIPSSVSVEPSRMPLKEVSNNNH